MGSAEPFPLQRMQNIIRGARKNAEPLESQQEKRKTGLLGFYYRRVLCASNAADCAVVKRINSTVLGAGDLQSFRSKSDRAKEAVPGG